MPSESFAQAELTLITEVLLEQFSQGYTIRRALQLDIQALRSWVQGLVYHRVSNQHTQRIWKAQKKEIGQAFTELDTLIRQAETQVGLLDQLINPVIPNNSL